MLDKKKSQKIFNNFKHEKLFKMLVNKLGFPLFEDLFYRCLLDIADFGKVMYRVNGENYVV